MFRSWIVIAALITSSIGSTVATADDDVIRFLGALNQAIQENQRNQQLQQQGETGRAYSLDPNQSGRQNMGQLNSGRRNNFFNTPQPQAHTQPFNQNMQFRPQSGFRPQSTFPSQSTFRPQQGSVIRSVPSQRIVSGQSASRSGNSQLSDPPLAPKTYSRLPIEIRCEKFCEGRCSYELVTGTGRSFPYSIGAAQSQQLKETTDWSVRYRPSPGSPSRSFRLRGGRSYEFRQAGGQWQLYILPE